jgi:F0F1-type ATP synthase assembly protein I
MPPLSDAASRTPAVRSSRRELVAGLDQASVMGMELLVAVLAWAGIGWLVDRWLGTGPWLLAIGALVGNAAGLYLIWLRSARMDAMEESRRAREAGGEG